MRLINYETPRGVRYRPRWRFPALLVAGDPLDRAAGVWSEADVRASFAPHGICVLVELDCGDLLWTGLPLSGHRIRRALLVGWRCTRAQVDDLEARLYPRRVCEPPADG